MKYRKRPVIIEAVQYSEENYGKYPQFVIDAISSGDIYIKDKVLYIRTLEGVMSAEIGSYIVQGVKGELYAVREDIFLETYEEVK